MRPALLIMAAGIGSRFGGGIKQLTPIDPYGHLIIDYSIHDAIEAGFGKIVFVIRRDIEADFRAMIGDRIAVVCEGCGVEIGYAYQELTDIPGSVPTGRTKPWGTGQAVLAADRLFQEPFAVINADDYYGKEAYRRLYAYLSVPRRLTELCMAGFILGNTLSEHGGVTRGLCETDGIWLTNVTETRSIVRTADGAASGGHEIPLNTRVSMNMWGMEPGFLGMLQDGFTVFLDSLSEETAQTAEYLLPVFIGQLLRERRVTVEILPTADRWFGVTYREDRGIVERGFAELIRRGVYQPRLFDDVRSLKF